MSNKDLWKSILLRLKPTIKLPAFKTWFLDTAVLNKEGSSMEIGFPTPFACKWVQDKYHIKLLQAASEIDPEITDITYTVQSSLSNEDSVQKINIDVLLGDEDVKKIRKVRGKNEVHIGKNITSRRLSIKYTLDNFVVGKDNKLAHAACLAVANMPGGIYNPLYIFSGVGLGKTHLLQATGREIINNNSNSRIVYMTAEQFTNEIIEAIGKRRTKSFKDKYRTVDCFILDDIQFLENKDMSQMEFFHTFNDLYESNKQIILSSDSPPRDLDGLKERLKGRFGMGTVVEILPPDYETRIAILNQRCRDMQIIMSPEIIEFIAFHIENNVRDLLGVLMQVISQSTLNDTKPSLDIVADILKKQHKIQEIHNYRLNPVSNNKIISVQRIIDSVAHYFQINKEDLMGPARKREILTPRQICMYLIRRELDHSYEKIGELFGGRNHTTVIHAFNTISGRLKTDHRLLRDITALKKDIGL